MSTVAALLDMLELDAPDTLIAKQAKLIVRRVVDVSQDQLFCDELWKTRERQNLKEKIVYNQLVSRRRAHSRRQPSPVKV